MLDFKKEITIIFYSIIINDKIRHTFRVLHFKCKRVYSIVGLYLMMTVCAWHWIISETAAI